METDHSPFCRIDVGDAKTPRVLRPPVGVVRVRLSLLATHNFWRADSRYMKRDEAAAAQRGGGLLAMEVIFL